MIRPVIGFCGRIGAGKSTAARHLVDRHGAVRVRFAGPLKGMMAALGLAQAEIDGDRKEMPCGLLGGRTPRHAMQTLGTEWGRDLIDPGLWIRAWSLAADAARPALVVADDVRFPNEAAAIRARGGIIVRIERAGFTASSGGAHVSELIDLAADLVLANSGDIDGLGRALDAALGSPAAADHAQSQAAG